MSPSKSLLICALLVAGVLAAGSCSGEKKQNVSPFKIAFAGSTPGDVLIKTLLTIHAETKVDFIKWNLILNNNDSIQKTFSLTIVFGEVQQNTLGFKGGGEKFSFTGEYAVSQNQNESLNGEIYHLKSSKLPNEIILLKLNDNLLHLLTPQNQLMIGNGGWSYTLNRLIPILASSARVASPATSRPDTTTSSDTMAVFDGRTLCDPALLELNGISTPGCQRIKWRLTLYQNSKTHTPTNFQLKAVYVGTVDSTYIKKGNWEVIQGTKTNSKAFIYLLKPDEDKIQETLALLKGDDNVLFFLDKEWNFFVGNADNSYTLNRSFK